MPDAWHCECGYTNLGSKTCVVCRRPRQAVPPPPPEARIDEPPPAKETVERVARPRAPAKKKAATRTGERSAVKKKPKGDAR